MKTNSEKKRQVYVALTKRGRNALQSLRRKLQVSQSDAVEFAVILAESGSLSASVKLAPIGPRAQEVMESL